MSVQVARRRHPRSDVWSTILIEKDLLDKLKPHAQQRLITVNELSRRILEAVADDSMVDAVLDDMELPK